MYTLNQPLTWAPDGMNIETIPAGEHDELPEKAIQIALELNILEEIERQELPPENTEKPEPEPEPEPVKKASKK